MSMVTTYDGGPRFPSNDVNARGAVPSIRMKGMGHLETTGKIELEREVDADKGRTSLIVFPPGYAERKTK